MRTAPLAMTIFFPLKMFSPKILFAVVLGLFGVAASSLAETISFPLQLDYPFLRTLMIQSAFTDPGQTLIITDPNNDCRRISLSHPRFEQDGATLRFEAAVHLKGGASVGGDCVAALAWDGYLTAHLKPRMSASQWRLSFAFMDSVLLDKNRRPDNLVGYLWEFFEAPVMARMSQIRIPVHEPIDQLKPFLLEAVPAPDQPRVQRMLDSLRPGPITSLPKSLNIAVMADIEPPPAPAPGPPPAPLTPQELEAFMDIWQTWDSFLVHALLSLLDMPLTGDERDTLLTVLLETRHRFVEALGSEAPQSSRDFVREQFLAAWEQLAPVLKSHLTRSPSPNAWGYLAFFTAADALAALDRLGPLFQMDISRDGFIRLARMLSFDKTVTLTYSLAVDPALRRLLALGEPLPLPPPPADPPPPDPFEAEDLSAGLAPLKNLAVRLIVAASPRPCLAASPSARPSPEELHRWIVTRDNIQSYVKKTKAILETVTLENFAENTIPESYKDIFQKAVYATAWQETCFRQFILKNNKPTYILSYTKTSVGLMQVNEKVWRGLYDLEQLRWNIHYNARAGVDILNLYLRKYAFPKMKSFTGAFRLDNDGVACALYAMYNAGPGGLSGYVKRRSRGDYNKIDRHFSEKFEWVKAGRWERLTDCFF